MSLSEAVNGVRPMGGDSYKWHDLHADRNGEIFLRVAVSRRLKPTRRGLSFSLFSSGLGTEPSPTEYLSTGMRDVCDFRLSYDA